MRGKSIWKKAIAFAAVLVALWLVYPGLYKESGAKTDLSMDEFEDIIGTYNIDDSILSYKDYMKEHASAAYPDAVIRIGASDAVRYEEGGKQADLQKYAAFEGREGDCLLTTENALVEYEFNVEKEGFYNLSFLYYPVAGKNSDIERSIFIDGKLPFKEMSMVTFSRVWMNYTDAAAINENGVTEKL